jgi:hypothetical protein
MAINNLTSTECVIINETWEKALDFLNNCTCCERHGIDRPKRDIKWYDRGSPKKNLNKHQYKTNLDWRIYVKYCFPCECTCRSLAREISRKSRKFEIERCPVREDLYSKFKNIIDNTFECSICFNDFKTIPITTLNMCGHTFCKKCIKKWFGFNDCIECPLCRTLCWSNTLHIGTWNQKCRVYV